MKKNGLLLMILAFAFQVSSAQTITGTWNGALEVMQTQLHLVLHVTDTNGHLSATMDSPNQNAAGIPVSKITFTDNQLHFEVGGGAIIYDGQLTEGDSIKGTFQQSGRSFPLTLHRGSFSLNRPQEPQPPFPYNSEDVHFTNDKAGITLAGTLTLPKDGKNFPAVVLITGSGAQDRDETVAGHKPFLVIADYLTRQGIAVLRFDDRGTAQSEGDFSTATTADLATDVEAAVRFLEQRKDINAKKIGLIGHSEGGIIAPMVAASDKQIDFIVLLAGPGVDGADLLLMQNEALGRASGMSEEELADAKKANDAAYQIAMMPGDDSVIRQKLSEDIMAGMPEGLSAAEKEKKVAMAVGQLMSPWVRYFLKNNPADYLKKVRCPVLALGGTKDLQVPAEKNITAIKQALVAGGDKQVTTKIFPGLNHLFQHATTGLPQEYSTIEETFAPEVLTYIGDWIKKQIR